MKTLKALKPDQVDESTKEVFAAIKQKVGMLPNLYAAIGNSPKLLQGFLAFEATLKEGTFSNKENEAIALAVSQINNCQYCLAAHSTIVFAAEPARDRSMLQRRAIDAALLRPCSGRLTAGQNFV